MNQAHARAFDQENMAISGKGDAMGGHRRYVELFPRRDLCLERFFSFVNWPLARARFCSPYRLIVFLIILVRDTRRSETQVLGSWYQPGLTRSLADICRVLGDISLNNQPQQQAAKRTTGVLTRRAAQQLKESENVQGRDSWSGRPRAGLRPRDESATLRPSNLAPLEALNQSAQDHEMMSRSAVKQSRRRIDEVDVNDMKDPLAAADFVKYIFKSYRNTEQKVRISSSYMSRQQDINEKMRSILIDWLVDVHLKFKLVPETLYLTVNLIDRFLMVKSVSRKHLQLVGVTAMLVASKYEEIWAPEVRDFVYISDRAYNRDQILNMEKIMLNSLKFNLTVPTHYHFLHRFLKVAGLAGNEEAVNYASYLVELALPEYSMLRFRYSQVAAAAVYATMSMYEPSYDGMRQMHQHSTYSREELAECIELLGALYVRAPEASLTAVHKKFSLDKMHNVASRGPPAVVDMDSPMEF